MGFIVSLYYYEDYGVSFGCDRVDVECETFSSRQDAWNYIVDSALNRIISEGRLTIVPYSGMYYCEDPHDWWGSEWGFAIYEVP